MICLQINREAVLQCEQVQNRSREPRDGMEDCTPNCPRILLENFSCDASPKWSLACTLYGWTSNVVGHAMLVARSDDPHHRQTRFSRLHHCDDCCTTIPSFICYELLKILVHPCQPSPQQSTLPTFLALHQKADVHQKPAHIIALAKRLLLLFPSPFFFLNPRASTTRRESPPR